MNLSLIHEIAAELSALPGNSITHVAVRNAAVNDVSAAQVVNELYEQSQDNRPLVSKILGESLLRKIENLCTS